MATKTNKTNSIKLQAGSVYQKTKGGTYYFRYQVNTTRKAVSLKTKNREEAIEKAQAMAPLVKAPSMEVVAAHVNTARNWSKKRKRLELTKAWPIYDDHPDRAHPATVNIYMRYESYFQDFVKWATDNGHTFVDQITDAVAKKYIDHLKEQPIAVDTHNKRISRIGHVFRILADYAADNTTDWSNPNFKRRSREETGIGARRIPFTKDQEEAIFAVLDDPKKKCINKPEMKLLFYLGAYTGQRLKDCALLQWHKVDLVRHRINVTQFKTGKEVVIPIAGQLLEVLRQAEVWKENGYVLPNVSKRYLKKNVKGKEIGAGFLNNDVMRIIKWAGIEPNQKVEGRTKAVSVYGFHSLRHSFVSFCVDHNIPKAVVVSILGADSDIIDQYYTHIGIEAQEQAIQLISGNGTSIKQRHEQALLYLKNLDDKSEDLQKLELILRG